MHDEVSRAIKRAYERVEVLDAFAGDFDVDTPRPDRNAKAAKAGQRFLRGAEEMGVAVEAAVQATMGVLAAAKPRIQPGMRKRPPKWWRHAVEALRDDALKGAGPTRVLSTLVLFEPHLDVDASPDLVPFILLASDDQRELMIEMVPVGLRSMGQPHSQQKVLVYNPYIDDNIRRSFDEAGAEVLTFPQLCNSLFRTALDEISILVE